MPKKKNEVNVLPNLYDREKKSSGKSEALLPMKEKITFSYQNVFGICS